MVMKSRVWELRENPPKCGSLSWNASVTWKICCCCKILVENKRHLLHESPKGGTWKLSHFGCMTSLTCNLEFHRVFLYRSLINTFHSKFNKSPNNPTWKVFVVQQLPAIFQFYILDQENPTAKWKRTQTYTILQCTRYIYIFLQLNFPLQTSAWAKGELLEKNNKTIFINTRRYYESCVSDRVAQWISAPDFGSGGRGFESHRGRQSCLLPADLSCFLGGLSPFSFLSAHP